MFLHSPISATVLLLSYPRNKCRDRVIVHTGGHFVACCWPRSLKKNKQQKTKNNSWVEGKGGGADCFQKHLRQQHHRRPQLAKPTARTNNIHIHEIYTTTTLASHHEQSLNSYIRWEIDFPFQRIQPSRELCAKSTRLTNFFLPLFQPSATFQNNCRRQSGLWPHRNVYNYKTWKYYNRILYGCNNKMRVKILTLWLQGKIQCDEKQKFSGYASIGFNNICSLFKRGGI